MSLDDLLGDGFEYQGYLLFNGIYKTDFIGEEYHGGKNEASGQLSKDLPEYRDTDQSSSEGYLPLNLREALFDDPSISEELETVADQIIANRYVYETRDTVDAYYNGDEIQAEVPSRNDADIYWEYPDYLYLRGSKDDVDETREKTFKVLQGNVKYTPIDFDGDFLLWLYYKTYEGQGLPTRLSVDRFTDTEITGDRDAFGETNSVDDSTDLEVCIPMIAGILRDKSISMLQGYYDLYNQYKLKAQVGSGRVHIKATEGDIQTATDSRRMAISLAYLSELLELHGHWQNLPPTDKYPPRSFFEDLYQTAQDQGIEIESISQDVLDKYGGLRDEDW